MKPKEKQIIQSCIKLTIEHKRQIKKIYKQINE